MVRKSTVNKGESKEDRFVRLAKKRMSRAIKDIGIIGNLAAPNYAYQTEQIEKMKTAIQEAVDETFSRFGGKKKAEGFEF